MTSAMPYRSKKNNLYDAVGNPVSQRGHRRIDRLRPFDLNRETTGYAGGSILMKSFRFKSRAGRASDTQDRGLEAVLIEQANCPFTGGGAQDAEKRSLGMS
ncbi:MAG: hypothetical protein Q4G07_08890 [Oscillospiraceae bacterium]|nr:hypothetical protein [Oscillospiraceae bacterium]